MDAYNTDVRPLLAELRESRGLTRDPMAAYAGPATRSDRRERVGGQQAGWGLNRLSVTDRPGPGRDDRPDTGRTT
jgi:hypothetical protein